MKVFDLEEMPALDQKEKNVFFQTPRFKVRIIELSADGEIAPCEMASYVIFYVIEGLTRIAVNGEETTVSEKKCLITEPATISMKSKFGARIMGIQIADNRTE